MEFSAKSLYGGKYTCNGRVFSTLPALVDYCEFCATDVDYYGNITIVID